MEIHRIRGEGWRSLRDVGLRALVQAPDAFSSGYDRESGLPDREWQRRAGRAEAGNEETLLLALAGAKPVGMIGAAGIRQPLPSNPHVFESLLEIHRTMDQASIGSRSSPIGRRSRSPGNRRSR